MKNGRAHALGWAAAIIGVLAVVRMLKGAGDPPYGVDASYYYQLARHVMNGEGLVTTVSLYHEGWVAPAKTPIYPLWPLVLGYTGRAIGLARAADLLPRLFYLLNLVLLYALASRIGARRITERWWIPNTAHWIVLIFGLAPRYFGATTHPYTEGLAFAMAFASLLALARFERTRGLGAVALSGLFAGLAFLARTQMVGIAVGCFCALMLFAIWGRRGVGTTAAGTTAAGAAAPLGVWSITAIATIAPWFLFLGFIPGLMPWSLPRVQLPHFAGWSELPSTQAWLSQRASSLGVMFDPSNAYSYVQSFCIVAFLVPLALIAWLFERRRPQSLLNTAVLIAGVFFFFNLMLYHSEVWMPWLFGWRHGLPYIFLIALAVPFLVARAGRYSPAIALVLLVSAIMIARSTAAFVRAPDPKLTAGEVELVRFLESNKAASITTNAQILGSMTDAPLYWTHCNATGESTKAMLRLMPARYVILYGGEVRCRFATEAGAMRVVRAFGERGQRVLVLEPLR